MLQQLFKTALPLGLFFVFLFIYTTFTGPIPFSVTSVTTTKTDSFSVTGEGVAATKPDSIVISAGIQTNETTVKAAQEKINNIINSISTQVKNIGVSAEDIQTSNYNIYPNYDYSQGSQQIIGFQATTNLTIKSKDLVKANNIIDIATTNGANQINTLAFEISDRTKLEKEARQKAVKAAKLKAEQAAIIAGFKLGKIINYSENFTGETQPIPLTTPISNLAEERATTSIEPGSSEVKVTVTLGYEVL